MFTVACPLSPLVIMVSVSELIVVLEARMNVLESRLQLKTVPLARPLLPVLAVPQQTPSSQVMDG